MPTRLTKKALIAGTEFGLAREASSIYPDDHWAHNPALKPVKYDPELSKRLLKEAGYGGGLTIRGYSGNSTDATSRTAAVKNMLAGVGITWKVDALEPAAIDDRMKNLEYDLSFSFIPWIQDPSSPMENIYKSGGRFNAGRFSDPEIDRLINAGREAIAEKDRKKIYFELEQRLYDNYADVWLWWEKSVVARQKRILGYNPDWFVKGRTHYIYSHPMWFKDGKRK